jgi:hypothetical protein
MARSGFWFLFYLLPMPLVTCNPSSAPVQTRGRHPTAAFLTGFKWNLEA